MKCGYGSGYKHSSESRKHAFNKSQIGQYNGNCSRLSS